MARLAALVLLVSGPARAADFDGEFVGANDFGNVGLLQTPTARMRAEGEFGIGVSTVRPYNQIHFFLQPLPWLEGSVRYTDVTNRFYGAQSFSGNQHYKDKSADLKVRLLTEGEYLPALALGVQDIGGTGLFSSEYLVSSYHWYDLDFSLGLAWGRLGAGGTIYNPFRLASNHFDKNRYSLADQQSTTISGSVGFNRLFTGQTIGPFGGVEWATPVKGLALRLEYDGNDYKHEGLADNQRQSSPINFGLAYRGISGVDMGVALERGNTVMARFAIYTNLQRLRGVPKAADPPPAPLRPLPADAPASVVVQPAPAPAAPVGTDASAAAQPGAAVPSAPRLSAEERSQLVLKLRQALREQGFELIALDCDDYLWTLHVWLSQNKFRNPAKATGRAARVVAANTPAQFTKFTLVFVDSGVENYRAEVARRDFQDAAAGNDRDAALAAVTLEGPGEGYGGAQYYDASRLPKFTWDTGPAVRQSVGGPNTFYAGQLYWKLGAGLQVTDHLSFSGEAGFNIINNFNQIKLQSNSVLPHVRSDVVKYLQQGGDGLINLEADYIWSPAPDFYHRMSLGIFEEMYAGAATELLYRPYGSHWAVAADINRVRQRGYAETFDFLNYTVTTGHATLYYRVDYGNLLFKLSAGRYLARDKGATLDVSKLFDSGVRVGVFATKTNVSAAEFGEGSFDKGVYITLPLDLFFASSTRRESGFAFRPLTRDGGQMVYDGPELYFLEKDGQPRDFAKGASELLR